MKLAVRKTLDEFGVRAVAEAADIPFWTLRKWRDADRVPGQGAAHDWRVGVLLKAIDKLRRAQEMVG